MAYGDIIEYGGVRYKNITPNMTSDTTPAPYKITVSDYYPYDYWYPYCAFSDPPQNNVMWWWASAGNGAHWAMFDYAQPTKVDMIIYEVTEAGYLGNGRVVIQGSNDGATFTSINGQTMVEAAKTVTYCNYPVKRCYFVPSQQQNYRYYRFETTADTAYWYTTGYVRFFETLTDERYLLHDGEYKTIAAGKLQALAEHNLSGDVFKQQGFSDLSEIEGIAGQLNKQFDVLRYSLNNTNNALLVNHLPAPQLVIPTESIDLSAYSLIKQITLTTSGAKGAVKVVFSFDHGSTWKTHLSGVWQEINLDAEGVMAAGMTPTELSAITREQWNQAAEGYLRVAYCLGKTTAADNLAVVDLSITGDTACWELAGAADCGCSYTGAKTMVVKLLADGSYKINYTKQK